MLARFQRDPPAGGSTVGMVDGSHVYWTNYDNTVGRADLDGQNVNQSFITSCSGAFGLAVDPE